MRSKCICHFWYIARRNLGHLYIIKTNKPGIYCYTVMPFGLKNAGATYQRMATALLHDMMHKEVEVYVDDMIVKSATRGEHITNLRKFFERIKKYKLRLNPNKCTFGVTAGKLLGHMVSSRGIEVDPTKIKAILEMPPPKTEKEIRGFLGRLQYISRFIARLTTTCEPIFKLLKKGEPKEWTEDCQKAFEAVKEYLSNPPVLAPPKPGRPLNLYLSVIEDALGSMLAQEDEDKQEHAIYYLSKRLKDYETRYTAVEKSCYALVWAVQKLRHILLAHQVLVVARMDPLKYLFEKPALTGKLSRWLILLAEFDLTYVAKNTIKGRVIAEHCAGHPVGEDDLDDDFPDEDVLNVEEKATWKMYFDGASNQHGYGVGVLLIAPDGVHIPLSAKLNFVATNNVAEYEACIVGLEALLAIDVKEVEIYGDSALVLAQAQRIWKMKEEHLKPYQAYLERVCQKFTKIEYTYVPRSQNQFADALATLASLVQIPENTFVRPIEIKRREAPAHEREVCVLDDEINDGKPWYYDIRNFVEDRVYPEGADRKDRRALRLLATQYILCGGVLYRRSYEGVHLRCVDKEEAEKLIKEVHQGVCGPHMNGRMLAKKIVRLGFYWVTMEADCIEHAKKCHQCQIHSNLNHLPPKELYNMTSPWPFSVWGIDIIGKITPKASNGHEFILVAIDYFTKWVEAASFSVLKAKHVARFIESNIICRYGVPHEIISDNGMHFEDEVQRILQKYGVKHHKSSPYRPQTNGAVESANKNVKVILEKTTERYRDWADKLPFALWGYRTSIRTSTGMTPYSLVYGMEAVLPAEIEAESLRIILESQIPEAEWVKARYEQLILTDEKRLKALYHVQGYQRRMARAFNKKVKPRN
jgi:ribonuclease HI